MSPTESSPAVWLSALRESQQRLAALVTPLTPAEVAGPSYASEWSIAQVLSHLGSASEIFGLYIEAGLDGSPTPGMEQFQPIWDTWNAKSAEDQARDGLQADAAFVERLAGLSDAAWDTWQLEMFGGEQRLVDIARFRLAEHALHSWDVAVSLDSGATLQPDAVALVVDHLGMLVTYTAKAPEQPVSVAITTDEPARHFRLHAVEGGLALSPSEPGSSTDGDATLRLPAEALIRLIYGRLDPEHTPSLDADGIDIASLRQMFPGA